MKKNHHLPTIHALQFSLVMIILFSASQLGAQTIVYPGDGSKTELQAAKELRRYIFLRTGTAPDIATADTYNSLPEGDVIVVSGNSREIITELKQDYGNVDAPASDKRNGYIIKSINKDGRNVLVLVGADTLTTLNAAYRFAELIGCHFNLAGDVIPDQKLTFPLDIGNFDEKAQPWFELRGCLPFHNFLAGPDLWETNDYKSFISQQAKMGFNFFGLHVYGEYDQYGPLGVDGDGEFINYSKEGPEPHLWVGHRDDVNSDGTVKPEAAYESYWASTFRANHSWSNEPIKTSDFTNGADRLFPYDEAASEAIGFKLPLTPAEKAANFNKVGELLRESFTHAKQLGVKTALGSTAPMGFLPKHNREVYQDRVHYTPVDVQNRAQEVHGLTLPTSRGYTNEVFAKRMYEGLFTRIARTHPLDYFWLWTFETMTYGGDRTNDEAIEAVADDYRYCNEVMTKMETPIKMATFGWRVGSVGYGSSLEFHDDLPLDVPFGTLWDDAQGIKPVIDAGREGWSSVWYEEDWGLVQPQLRAMDAWFEVGAGLRAGGTQALVAKHWRVNSIAPASLAHAKLSWDNKATVDGDLLSIAEGAEKYRFFDKWDAPLESQDPSFVNWITKHYQDWAKANFGPERSDEIGSLLAMADRLGESHQIRRGLKGGIPKVARWLPSSITEFWLDDGDIVDYTDPTFIDAMYVYTQFCSYKDDIVGTGNIDRYLYWYHFFQAQLELSKLVVHEYFYRAEDRTPARKDSIIKTWAKVMEHEINRVRNVSELGVIAQLQQSTWDRLFKGEYDITERDVTFEADNAVRAYPEITQINENENFVQKVIFMGNGTVANPTMYYRKIGASGPFSSISLTPVNNSSYVMTASLADPGYDFEYYIQGTFGSDSVTYPVTGGYEISSINKTVITVEKIGFEPEELAPVGTIPDYTSVSENKGNSAVLIYPNPATDQIRVEASEGIEKIRIYSMVGELLLTDKNPTGLVSMSDFPNGIYIVEVKTGGQSAKRKVVKR